MVNKSDNERLSGCGEDGYFGLEDENDPSSERNPECRLEMEIVTGQSQDQPALEEKDNAAKLGGQVVVASAPSSDILLLGYHTIHNLGNTDLPTYVRENSATLTFPEKVSSSQINAPDSSYHSHSIHFLHLRVARAYTHARRPLSCQILQGK
jgi:hypothetical protein